MNGKKIDNRVIIYYNESYVAFCKWKLYLQGKRNDAGTHIGPCTKWRIRE